MPRQVHSNARHQVNIEDGAHVEHDHVPAGQTPKPTFDQFPLVKPPKPTPRPKLSINSINPKPKTRNRKVPLRTFRNTQLPLGLERAKMAQTRQARPDSGLDWLMLKHFKLLPLRTTRTHSSRAAWNAQRWHKQDSQGQNLALTFKRESLHLKVLETF